MDEAGIAGEVARIDALLDPILNAPVDTSDPDWTTKMVARFNAMPPLDEVGERERTEAVLHAIIALYADGDEPARAALRNLVQRFTSFRWAAQLPWQWDTPAAFRARLIYMSVRDQAADARDEILALQALCAQAREAGIDVEPILGEVAEMSSLVDKQGMGSTKEILLSYGRSGPGKARGQNW